MSETEFNTQLIKGYHKHGVLEKTDVWAAVLLSGRASQTWDSASATPTPTLNTRSAWCSALTKCIKIVF